MANFAYPQFVDFVKGAPDVILDRCSHIQQAGAAAALTEEKRKEVLDQNRDMASNALRVLAVAYRPLQEVPASVNPETVEKDLVFVGLLGMIDPPRPEVIAGDAVSKVERYGIPAALAAMLAALLAAAD